MIYFRCNKCLSEKVGDQLFFGRDVQKRSSEDDNPSPNPRNYIAKLVGSRNEDCSTVNTQKIPKLINPTDLDPDIFIGNPTVWDSFTQ